MDTHGKSCNCRIIWVNGSILKIIVDGRTYDLRVAVPVKTLAMWGKYSVGTSGIEVGVVGNGRAVLSQARLATRGCYCVVEQLLSLCRCISIKRQCLHVTGNLEKEYLIYLSSPSSVIQIVGCAAAD